MSINLNVSGDWKAVTKIKANVSGVWKTVSKRYQKIDGVWKQDYEYGAVPDDLISFSTVAVNPGWDKLDGVEESPSLIGKYPRISDHEGEEGGSETHEHDQYTGNTGGGSNILRFNEQDHGSDSSSGKAHTHTMNHVHPATNHEPPYLEVVPIANGKIITTDMFLFFDGAVAPTGWGTKSAAVDKFVKCADVPGGIGTQIEHTHIYTGVTGTTTPRAAYLYGDVSGGVESCLLGSHRHTMNHTHLGNVYPEWQGMIPVSPTTDTDFIPSGMCAFFKGSVVPFGWKYYSKWEGKWIQGKTTNTESGGSNSHDHTYTGNTSSIGGHDNANAGTVFLPAPHSHTMNHIHEEAENIPPYKEMMFLKRI